MAAPPPSALEIARALIACRSVTPADDGRAALPQRDASTRQASRRELVAFAEPGTPQILNLYARFGTQAPNFAFAGHTDVVPPGDLSLWRCDPFEGAIADGKLYGRGACDMKGGVAASVAAALRFLRRGRFERFDQLSHHRRRGGAGDQRHRQAARMGARARRALRSLRAGRAHERRRARRRREERPARFADGAPAADRQTGPRRLSPSRAKSDPLAQRRARRAAIAAARRGNGGFRRLQSRDRHRRRRQSRDQRDSRRGQTRLQHPLQRHLDADDAGGGDRTPPSRRAAAGKLPTDVRSHQCGGVPDRQRGPSPISSARAIREVTGREPKLSTSGGTSDARFIKDACPVVELGLVGASMHGIDEHADIEDMEKLTRIYERTLELYFAADAAASG